MVRCEKDDGHPVVDGTHELVCVGGDDRARPNGLAFGRRPVVVEARKGQESAGAQADIRGTLPAPLFCHSKHPSATMRQRRCLKALLKLGCWDSVSARALIIRLPIEGSLAQAGMRPQRRGTKRRAPLSS